MPVEIKELVIRTVVQQEDAQMPGGGGDGGGDQDAIVEACVRQVLQILKNSKER